MEGVEVVIAYLQCDGDGGEVDGWVRGVGILRFAFGSVNSNLQVRRRVVRALAHARAHRC